MPRVPDASMMTQFQRARATVVADPTVKSRTFVAPIKDGYQTAVLQASDVRPSRPVPVFAWTSPDFKGRIFLK